jgi:hypothetical protein
MYSRYNNNTFFKNNINIYLLCNQTIIVNNQTFKIYIIQECSIDKKNITLHIINFTK